MQDVEIAIIEGNGSLSVLKTSPKHTITREDINIKKENPIISSPIIIEEKICDTVLHEFNIEKTWLLQKLSQQGIDDLNDIFFAIINHNLEIHISLRDESNIKLLSIIH